MSDQDYVELCTEMWRNYIRFVPEVGFFVWNLKHWEQNEATVRNIVRHFSRYVSDQSMKARGRGDTAVQSHRVRKIIVSELEDQPGIRTTADLFDQKPYYLNFQNGTLNLETGRFRREHRLSDYLTEILPYAYDPEARCQEWEQFIALVSGEYEGLATYLQRIAGYSLTADIGAQVFFFLYGPPSTGKSTYINTVRRVLGCYADTTASDTFTGGNDTNKELIRIGGKRFVFITEPTKGERIREGKLKSFTGSDEITGRAMYEETQAFTPKTKLFIASNHKLSVDGSDSGFFRRLHTIPFRTTVPERDYWALFESEKQGIMNWLIEGARLWIAEGKGKQGLRIPPCIYTANEEYREDIDVLGEFLSLYVEDAEDGYITVEELYGFYEEFCFNRVPDRYKIAKNRLSSQITDRSTKYKTTKRYIDGKQVRVVEGLRQKSTAREEAVNRIVNSYQNQRHLSLVQTEMPT